MNVLLQGGLGNTMFQWAFGRSLSLRRGLPLSFDRSELDKDQKRKYRLDCYDIDVPIDNTTLRPARLGIRSRILLRHVVDDAAVKTR